MLRMGIPDVITKLRGAESLSLQPSFMQWKNVLMPIDYLLKVTFLFFIGTLFWGKKLSLSQYWPKENYILKYKFVFCVE